VSVYYNYFCVIPVRALLTGIYVCLFGCAVFRCAAIFVFCFFVGMAPLLTGFTTSLMGVKRGSPTRFFLPLVFHQTSAPDPWSHMKRFRIRFQISQNNKIYNAKFFPRFSHFYAFLKGLGYCILLLLGLASMYCIWKRREPLSDCSTKYLAWIFSRIYAQTRG
jgi:hypothetical protein